MKSPFFISLNVLFCLIICLSGCARYTAIPLNQLAALTSAYESDQHIGFTYRVFTRRDCKLFLDRDVISKGYQPVHITITNNSRHPFSFLLSNINLPTVQAEDVASQVHTNTVGRVLGYGIVGLFIWPLIIPAIVDGIGSSDANRRLDYDYNNKILRDQVIPPYGTANGLIFVPCGYFKGALSIILIDLETQKRIILNTVQSRIALEQSIKQP